MGVINSKSYHGAKKRKVIGVRTLAASPCGTQTIVVDASKGDLFTLATTAAGCGACDIVLNIINAHDGQEVWVRYDANNNSDDTVVNIHLNGVTITDAEPTVVTSGDHLYSIKIFDSNDETIVYLDVTTI